MEKFNTSKFTKEFNLEQLPKRNLAKEMREAVAGWGALVEGREVGEIVTVGREVLMVLRKDWN